MRPTGGLVLVPKGKPWTREEEMKLRELRSEGHKVSEIAVLMGKSEEAVMKKLQRLGLKVVQQRGPNWTTSSVASEIIVAEELYSVEEALGMFAGAMKALGTPGLAKAEVIRLRSLVQAASVYQVKFAEYLDYRGIEKKLVELERKYQELVNREQESTPDKKQIENKQKSVAEQEPVDVGQDNHLEEAAKGGNNVVKEKGNQNQT